LEAVQTLRERERDSAAESYRQAMLAISKLNDEVERILQEHTNQQPLQSSSIQGRVQPQIMLESQRYQMHLMQQVAQLRNQIQLVQGEAEKRRLLLVKREQAVRSLEKLAEQQQAEWEIANEQRAQIALDEWAGFRYWKEQAE
jgi:flagellar export protein FliJ